MIVGNGSARSLVDWHNGEISREIFVNDDIYAQEQEQIFGRAWLYVGHESQIPNPGDFFVSSMGEESVILCRDRARQDPRLPQHLPPSRHEGLPLRRGQHAELHLPLPRLELRDRRQAGRRAGLREPLQAALRPRRMGPDRGGAARQLHGHDLGDLGQERAARSTTIWATPSSRSTSLCAAGTAARAAPSCSAASRNGSIPSNWKFVAENFAGDALHVVSHRSVDMVGIGPAPVEDKARRGWRAASMSAAYPEGHGITYRIVPPNKDALHYRGLAARPSAYFRNCWEKRIDRMGDKARRVRARRHDLPQHVVPRPAAAHHPGRAPARRRRRPRCGACYFVDKDAPEEVQAIICATTTSAIRARPG